MSVHLIQTDNVVYLSTYKSLKHVKVSFFMPYKNRYLKLGRDDRVQERARASAELLINPHDVLARLKRKAQDEVDFG